MEENERVRRVNNLVGRSYRAAVSEPLERFRDTMLRDAATVVPFDVAVWASGDPVANRVHTSILLDPGQHAPRRLELDRGVSPGLDALASAVGGARDVAEVVPTAALAGTGLYESVRRQFDPRSALATAYTDSRTGLCSLVALFRCKRGPAFDADDQRIQKHLVFHLINALSLAQSVYLGGIGAREMARSAAICDRHGVCHDSQQSFQNLVAEKFPDWDGVRLPFALPAPGERDTLSVRGVKILVDPVGDMLCVRAWREGPMDLLTEREHQVVDSVCRGLSYKEVARPLGIAPSTVSNHIYRVFDKLGVSSRTELAKLVGGWRQLH